MYRHAIILFTIILSVSFSGNASASDTLQQYSQKCDVAIGATVPDFVCDLGTEVPQTNLHADGTCDRPNVLNGVCDPGSRFQVLTNDANAAVVAHCRKKGNAPSDGLYGDIAVIQYSKTNGATCFYQQLSPTLSGRVSAPSKGLAPWLSPSQTAAIRCAGCHDNGPFIRSPYLAQLKDIPNEKNVLPGSHSNSFNSDQPYAFVGDDFAGWEAFTVEVKNNRCNDCHRMGVNNVSGGGTARDFGIVATAQTQRSKNPHSPTSPIWMTPHQTYFSQANADDAAAIKACAVRYLEHHELPNEDSCRIAPFAGAYTAPPPH